MAKYKKSIVSYINGGNAERRDRRFKEWKAASRKPRDAHPASGDPVYEDDEVEFMLAVQRFKTETGLLFPTNFQILMIVKSLGYSKGNSQ